MRIGIIRTGNIAAHWPGSWSLRATRSWWPTRGARGASPGLVAEPGERASARTAGEAARSGGVVIVAVPFPAYCDLPVSALAGKFVVDANNDWSGGAATATTSSSERFAAFLARATVVKVFNNIHYVHLAEQGTPTGTPGRRAIPIAGDDPTAKATVTQLINDVGFDVYDVGPLSAGRLIEPGSPAFNAGLTRDAVTAALA